MNDLNNTLTNVNRVLSGEQSVQVGIANAELMKVAGVLFITIFLAIALANLLKR